jgi:hypothetical protein
MTLTLPENNVINLLQVKGELQLAKIYHCAARCKST